MATATVALRVGTPADAKACGRICHDAFADIAARHNFPKDFPSPDAAAEMLAALLSHPGFRVVVAEQDGRIVGSSVMDERSPVFGIGPVSVDPAVQNVSVGRQLMQAMLDRTAERGAPGVRLMQDAFHNRSFVLYTKLGFQTRLTTSVVQGAPIGVQVPGCEVRPARQGDLEECNRLCVAVHGHDRGGELADAIDQGAALVVERDGRLTAYTTGVAFFGHSIGETNEDLKALIGASTEFEGTGFHVPNTNHELLRWCYDNGLRMVKAMTLMTVGPYSEPKAAYLPSISY